MATPRSLRERIDAMTAADLRARGSVKWTTPGPGGSGAAIAEMDFGAAPPVLEALARLAGQAAFGYLPPRFAADLADACASFVRQRYGWDVAPEWVRPVPDVVRVLELAITYYSRPDSAVILPTPAYMPFLKVPPALGREIIQVPMVTGADGRAALDLGRIEDAFRAGGHLLVLCNPHNPLGRVSSRVELTELTEVVDRHGGRVFADEIHAPLVYPGSRHIPYAASSGTAALHTITAVSASKAFNLPGLRCAQAILTTEADRRRWEDVVGFAARGASNPGVVANAAAYRYGEPWLTEVLGYLDESRHLLGSLLAELAPQIRYRPPEGTYLAWLDCTALGLPDSPGTLLAERAQLTVVDGPEFGVGFDGCVRLNFATPQPVLREMVTRLAAVLTAASR